MSTFLSNFTQLSTFLSSFTQLSTFLSTQLSTQGSTEYYSKLHSGINGGTFEEDTKTGEYLKNIVKNNFSKDKNKNIKSQTETRDNNNAKSVK